MKNFEDMTPEEKDQEIDDMLDRMGYGPAKPEKRPEPKQLSPMEKEIDEMLKRIM